MHNVSMKNNRSQLLSVPQFSEKLGITVACTRRWLLEGKIAHFKVGRLVKIDQSEAERILSEGFRPRRAGAR